jgi:hypothetical protein
MLKQVPAPKGAGRKELYWELTLKGRQKVAELKAITGLSKSSKKEP